MGLRLHRIKLADFRSYKVASFGDFGDLTLIVGPNASGKTNIVEAISLVTTGRSFRHAQNLQLIREGCTTATVIAESAGDGRVMQTELELEQGKKSFKVNGKAKRSADVVGMMPSVVFTPDDLQMVKRSPSMRREAADALGSQISGSYYAVRRDFEKVIRYKNKLLKEEADDILLDSIDETLVTCASQLMYFRTALLDRLYPILKENYGRISSVDEVFDISYTASWDYEGMKKAAPCRRGADGFSLNKEQVSTALARNLKTWRDEERRRGRAVVGPHNDKIEFFINGRDASDYASQGQQRSIVLAWKLAEAAVIEQSCGQLPLLLLDDVMSELDAKRRSMLVEFVRNDVQTFVTATDLDGFPHDIVEKADIVQLPLL